MNEAILLLSEQFTKLHRGDFVSKYDLWVQDLPTFDTKTTSQSSGFSSLFIWQSGNTSCWKNENRVCLVNTSTFRTLFERSGVRKSSSTTYDDWNDRRWALKPGSMRCLVMCAYDDCFIPVQGLTDRSTMSGRLGFHIALLFRSSSLLLLCLPSLFSHPYQSCLAPSIPQSSVRVLCSFWQFIPRQLTNSLCFRSVGCWEDLLGMYLRRKSIR